MLRLKQTPRAIANQPACRAERAASRGPRNKNRPSAHREPVANDSQTVPAPILPTVENERTPRSTLDTHPANGTDTMPPFAEI